MSTQLSVAASPHADANGAIAQVIASLPISLRSGSDRADLVAVSGVHWAEDAAAAANAGARGIMIVDPLPSDASACAERVASAGIPVVVDSTWARNPAVAVAAPHFAALGAAGRSGTSDEGAFESRIDAPVGSDLDQVLLAQLALVAAAVGPVDSVTIERWNVHGYDARGRLRSGARVALAAVLTGGLPTCATLRVLTRHEGVRMHLPSPETASCGTVTVSGPDGATLLPTLWETPHRAAWRELHRRVNSGESTSDLDDLMAHIATLRSARSRVLGSMQAQNQEGSDD